MRRRPRTYAHVMEPEENAEQADRLAHLEAVPLCHCCLSRVSPVDALCPTCGEGIGSYVAYDPYKKIKLTYDFFGRVFEYAREPGTHLPTRLWAGVVLIGFFPLESLLGLLLRRSREGAREVPARAGHEIWPQVDATEPQM